MPPGIFADQELLIHCEPALLQRIEHQDGRHELGHAGGKDEFIGILLVEHIAGARIDENGIGHARLERRRQGRGLGASNRNEQ